MKKKKMIVLSFLLVIYVIINSFAVYQLLGKTSKLSNELKISQQEIVDLNKQVSSNTSTINNLNKIIEDIKQ